MKNFIILISTLCVCMLSCTRESDEKDEQLIVLPVTYIEGFGAFPSSHSSAGAEYTLDEPGGQVWVKTYKPVCGIPKLWKNVTKCMVHTNLHQFVYQNFYEGNIDPDFYRSLQKDWKWKPDEKRLSKRPIRCYVYLIHGTDQSGKLSVMIDRNNNLDFSDEEPFYPEIASPSDTLRYYKNSYEIEYDKIQGGRVVTSHIPMVIKYLPHQPKRYQIAYAFPRYASAVIRIGNEEKTIAINIGFSDPSGYATSEVALMDSLRNERGFIYNKGIRIGEFLDFEIDGSKKSFQNLGYDEYDGVLRLKGEQVKNVYSTQVGYKLKPFTGRDFSDGSTVSLEDYRGKYLLIDFWATWCQPCVKELPELMSLYRKVNKDNIEFVGVVGEDTKEKLTKFLKKNPIDWPQIYSDSINKLIEIYNIDGYPSTFLIAPDGTILEKNLRGAKLQAKLSKLGFLKK
ncbi:TlpA family protein disulfide reductase [Dyadobacter fanqingshengii]|uniref:TlpA family protein disulfide reductase n=1 Tax=Dyadobacter fanqingshengii TaxID=2906443 RepID=A0A9X1TAE5_9BACT|nr:TlpA disulfide reductase family protein [Dyadobacter fanqingshengii]MCF0040849.1 TlpA family protein disulfide reductase [Dyadobacter fanqingshengii]USJ37418.1 TlpA family protein disulfide reductase [Dyadobacter fanqingshengii]